jgi:hypothetical protein
MQNAEAFYAAFARAGFLVQATWQPPAVGSLPQLASVRFLRSTVGVFDGQGQGFQATMVLPASVFVGIAKGHVVTIQPTDGPALNYRVHESALITGGTQREVSLKK